MKTARYPRILRTFVSALVILLTGAVHSPAGVIVGTSLDLTGTIYTGPLNTVQFVPVGSPQAVGGNVFWNKSECEIGEVEELVDDVSFDGVIRSSYDYEIT